MMTVNKLAGLPPSTRLRKAAAMLREWAFWIAGGFQETAAPSQGPPQGREPGQLVLLLQEVSRWAKVPESLAGEAAALAERLAGEPFLTGGERAAGPPEDLRDLARDLDTLHYSLLAHLGVSPGDWDFKTGENYESLDPDKRRRVPVYVYLDELRSPFNVGAVFRTAEAFGASGIFLSPHTPDPGHPRVRRTAMGAAGVLPWERRPLSAESLEGPVFALEVGGVPLDRFNFPSRGTVILGSEEFGLGAQAEAAAKAGLGKVSIPLLGAKVSLNVSVAFGILMQAWTHAILQSSKAVPSNKLLST